MTIKEYLKEHSEKDFIYKMMSAISMQIPKGEWRGNFLGVSFNDTEKIIKRLKQEFGIEIEEPDYLAEARGKRLKYIGRDSGIYEIFELYEKAIKQSKEEKQ